MHFIWIPQYANGCHYYRFLMPFAIINLAVNFFESSVRTLGGYPASPSLFVSASTTGNRMQRAIRSSALRCHRATETTSTSFTATTGGKLGKHLHSFSDQNGLVNTMMGTRMPTTTTTKAHIDEGARQKFPRRRCFKVVSI